MAAIINRMIRRQIPNPALKRLREERKLTQDALAKLVGCRQADIAKLESGRRPTNAIWATRLAEVLGVSPRDLFPDGDLVSTVGGIDQDRQRVALTIALRIVAHERPSNPEAAASDLATAIYEILSELDRAGLSLDTEGAAEKLLELTIRQLRRKATP